MSEITAYVEDLSQYEGSLKSLKDEIKNLRQELDNCSVGSEEFKDTLEQLTKAQETLKTVTKSTSNAVEGSYDALSNEMSRLKKEWKATADEAQRAKIGEKISEINTQLKDLDASLGNYQRNVGNYGTAFDGVTMKIEGGVAKFEKFNNVSRSIIGSFDLVEGGLKAIGVESEEVNSLMDSMQGAMMLTNGLQSVKEGVQAFTALRTSVASATVAQKALNAAQMANPIGAVVVAVTALIAGITALVKIIRKNRDEEEQLEEAYEATKVAMEARNGVQEHEIALMEARGESQAKILEQERAYAEANKAATEQQLKDLEKILEETGVFRIKKKKMLKEQIEDLKVTLREQDAAITAANRKIEIYDVKTKTEQIKNAKELRDKELEYIEETKNARIEALQKSMEESSNAYSKMENELDEYWLSENELKEKRANEWANTQTDILSKQYELRLITAEEYNNKLVEIEQIRADKIEQIIIAEEEKKRQLKEKELENAKKAAEEQTEKEKEEAEKRKETEEALKEAKLNITNQMLSGVSGLLQDLADAQDTNDREGFERSKKLQIAASTISMLQGVVNAVTSAMAPTNAWMTIAGQASMAAAMSGMVITSGLLQINKIKKQTFEGGGNTGDSSTGVTMPRINTSGLLSSPVNYTTEIQGAQAETDIPDTRVVVLESDITSTVNKVKVAQDESTF